jgi:hypothetical protein
MTNTLVTCCTLSPSFDPPIASDGLIVDTDHASLYAHNAHIRRDRLSESEICEPISFLDEDLNEYLKSYLDQMAVEKALIEALGMENESNDYKSAAGD